MEKKSRRENFFLDNDLDENIVVVRGTIKMSWVFIGLSILINIHTRKGRKGMWRILVMDGVSKHVHEEFIHLLILDYLGCF